MRLAPREGTSTVPCRHHQDKQDIGGAIDEALGKIPELVRLVHDKLVAVKPNETFANKKDRMGVTQPDALRAVLRHPRRFLIENFTSILGAALGLDRRSMINPGANVSDRLEGWAKNYRVPDVTVTSPGSTAHFCGTHWVGGPDFLVEVVSDEDRSRDKLEFYGQIGVREVLIVDRDPWSLELYRLVDGVSRSVGTTGPGQPHALASEMLPVSFRFIEEPSRPILEVRHADGVQVGSI